MPLGQKNYFQQSRLSGVKPVEPYLAILERNCGTDTVVYADPPGTQERQSAFVLIIGSVASDPVDLVVHQ